MLLNFMGIALSLLTTALVANCLHNDIWKYANQFPKRLQGDGVSRIFFEETEGSGYITQTSVLTMFVARTLLVPPNTPSQLLTLTAALPRCYLFFFKKARLETLNKRNTEDW